MSNGAIYANHSLNACPCDFTERLVVRPEREHGTCLGGADAPEAFRAHVEDVGAAEVIRVRKPCPAAIEEVVEQRLRIFGNDR